MACLSATRISCYAALVSGFMWIPTTSTGSFRLPAVFLNTRSDGGGAYADSTPTPSYQFRNCWVRPLPRTQRVAQLRPHKNYLQTAGLLCDANERTALEALLLKAGVVRIASGEHMSHSYCGMPHDGEFLLRR